MAAAAPQEWQQGMLSALPVPRGPGPPLLHLHLGRVVVVGLAQALNRLENVCDTVTWDWAKSGRSLKRRWSPPVLGRGLDEVPLIPPSTCGEWLGLSFASVKWGQHQPQSLLETEEVDGQCLGPAGTP